MRVNDFTRLVEEANRTHTPPADEDRFVSYGELAAHGIVYTRVHLRRLVLKRLFPAPVQMSANRIAWRMSDLAIWKASRPAAPTPKGEWESPTAPPTKADSARTGNEAP
jgi:predicted DNA-binding transcriptional regulator AlpA